MELATISAKSKPGRQPTVVNIDELRGVIARVEVNGPFVNRGSLYKAVASTEYAKGTVPRPLTAQAIMLLIKKHNLVVKTPMGKRGNTDALRASPKPVGKRPRKRVEGNPADRLKVIFSAPQYQHTLEKALAGNAKAAIKLKCLDCCCFQPKEISLCTSMGCPLWSLRPYQNLSKKNKEDSVLEDAEEVSTGTRPLVQTV